MLNRILQLRWRGGGTTNFAGSRDHTRQSYEFSPTLRMGEAMGKVF